MKNLVESIIQFLEQKEEFVMATIIRHEGSTPRDSGTKIVIRRNGSLIGTIGGGVFEADVIKAGADVFKTGDAVILSFNMTDEYLSTGNMVCGGSAEVLIELIRADSENLKVFQALSNGLKKRERCMLITALHNQNENMVKPERCLVMDDNSIYGPFSHSESSLDAAREKAADGPLLLPFEDDHFWVEPVLFPARLFLFGAGHVAKQVADLGLMVGFHTTVIDDRVEFASIERFPDPMEVRVIPGYEDCFNDIDTGRDSYLVIVTRGHLYDKVVLAQALRRPAVYIGMIGSRRKRDTIYKALLSEGFTDEDIRRVHCPIGLEIGADTPEEIAVSIIAELVQVRSVNQN